MHAPTLPGLWAVHIADDFLSAPWLVGGFVVAGLLAAGALAFDRLRAFWRGQELREEEVAYIAVLTSAFFVGSLIHIPAGPIKVHLLLNGLDDIGLILQYEADITAYEARQQLLGV